MRGNYHVVVARSEIHQPMPEGKTIDGRIDAQVRKIHLSEGRIDDPFAHLVDEKLQKWDYFMAERLRDSRVQVLNVGTKAVLDAIRKCPPLLGLHAHIYECHGPQGICRTVCESGQQVFRGEAKRGHCHFGHQESKECSVHIRSEGLL